MNFDVAKQLLIESTAEQGGFAWIDESEGDLLRLKSTFNLKCYDDEVEVHLIANKEGLYLVEFVFDRMVKSHDNLKLVNAFNARCLSLKAYVNNGSFLVVSYHDYCVQEEKEFVALFFAALNALVADDTQKYLTPLTIITE